MTDKEIEVIVKPIFTKMFNSNFSACDYGIECYKKGMEYQGIKELVIENDNLIKRVKRLEEQIEKMKKYGKLLQDICVVLGNDTFMVAVQLESVVKKLWDTSEEKEGLKMVEDIENRLLKIKPQEWAEITKWEIKEK